MIESLTYAELGARLGVSPEAARKKAKAARLPSTLGNDGRRRVSVDLCELRHTRRPAGHRPERAGAAAGPDLRAGELDELREEAARTYVQAAIEASLQERIRGLEDLAAEMRETIEDLRADRDAWRAQAQRSWWRRIAG